MTKKRLITIITAVVIVIVLGVAIGLGIKNSQNGRAQEISIEEAQQLVNKQFDAMKRTARLLEPIAEKNNIVVNSISYGDEKDIILECSVTTLDVHAAFKDHYDKYLSASAKDTSGNGEKADTKLAIEFLKQGSKSHVSAASEKTLDTQIILYETSDGLQVYATEAVVNDVYGGVYDIRDEIYAKKTVKVIDEDGNETEKEIEAEVVKDGLFLFMKPTHDTNKPDTSNWIGKVVNTIKKEVYRNLIEYDRWKTIFAGLWVTIKLTVCSAIIGIILGFLVAFTRCTYLTRSKRGILLKIGNAISQTYLTIIRGTPAVVQIMIIYFVIFMPIGVERFPAAVICFGLNSGAYVAEIVRGGIMSVDQGQTEAGRSLGFGYMQTMWHIVFPQAFKACLPSLANEFVVLLKETSVAFYIGLGDLMYAGNAIRAATYSPYTASIVVALIYFIMVLILSKLVGLLERRLRNSER